MKQNEMIKHDYSKWVKPSQTVQIRTMSVFVLSINTLWKIGTIGEDSHRLLSNYHPHSHLFDS